MDEGWMMTEIATHPGSARSEGVRSVVRAMELLQLFDARHAERPLRELVELTGLPKTTVLRLLATLEPLGLVAAAGEGTYGLGAGFLRWARAAQLVWEVSPEARAVMRELVGECGETVNVYIRQGTVRVCIAQEEGTATVRSVVDVGVPMTLAAGAPARILLGGAPPQTLAALAAKDPRLDAEALHRHAAAAAETGYAVSHGERELGASAVAAPIRTRQGRLVAALSASGPTSRYTADRVAGHVLAVMRAAARISEIGLGRVEAFL
ncbi:helix-turn-helix domain-containing protein [Actinomadura sp. LD22]|uniref:Helix-turn-helix domain-containing protein n=1 Tax=Actinomadura physcomitrii TaxID=2650748 RepID=A0A6I4MCY1_9ACTN|nr:IclR family transcriptional regulator [Actinomadura physcomitrii]MWA01641.1 helix-turn-helix domain-containing protein [Actinomadura physcomitrii]